MGSQSIVHGRILLDRDEKASQDFIKSLGEDKYWPQISTEMFGTGKELPNYYEYSVITFGATYKEVEDGWTSWILKFEHILRNVGFDTAKIQLETEQEGNYDFFWRSKNRGTDHFDQKDKLIETDEWFFGYGYRDRWGFLNSNVEINQYENISQYGRFPFKYPIVFTKEQKESYLEILNNIEYDKVGIKQYPLKGGTNFPAFYNLVYPMLKFLSFIKKMDFGYDEHTDEDVVANSIFFLTLHVSCTKESLVKILNN